MRKRLPQQKALDYSFSPSNLRVWHHPILVKVIEALEVFALEPGDGKLAASLVLASNQLIKYLQQKSKATLPVQTQALLWTRDRAFDWLKNEISSVAYTSPPSRSTNQIGKALNCALLLLCAQFLECKLPSQTQEKAYAYLNYMSEQGWPRDDLLPFVVSQLQKPRDLAIHAKQHLLKKIETWRSEADMWGISFALIQCQDELTEARRNELVSTLKARFMDTNVEMSAKAWGLLAFSKTPGITKTDLDNLAESLLDDLAQDRLINNEIIPTIRLISQFPFSEPSEIARRVENLKKSSYVPANRIKRVSEEGVLIDVFYPLSDETWSFALLATEAAFAVYALVATNNYEVVGFPAHYRTQLEESIGNYIELQNKKSKTILLKYLKWYKVSDTLIMLVFGGLLGILVAELSGYNWQKGGIAGIAFAAIVTAFNVWSQDFVIAGMVDWIKKQIENLIGVLSKK